MALWIYRNNSGTGGGGSGEGYFGDWADAFRSAHSNRHGTVRWGGPLVAGNAGARKLAESAKVGQRLLCWQRWGPGDASAPRGVRAAAIGIMEVARLGRNQNDEWSLRPVEQFDEPVPLLRYRNAYPEIDAVFSFPRMLPTFDRLSPQEERVIVELCRRSRQPVDSPNPRVQGQGFGEPESNAKVEKAAIAHVTKQLTTGGWTVKDLQAKKVGYDLEARRGKSCRHVEVKGVSGKAPRFFLTANELACAQQDEHWEVWVVTSALTSPKVTIVVGDDLLATHILEPITYRVTPLSAP